MKQWNIHDILSLYFVMGLHDSSGNDSIEDARRALEGGITCFQLREKNAPMHQVLEQGKKLRALCKDYDVPFFVNDRVDIALLLEADGVHVGQDDIPYSHVRSLVGSRMLIGVSASDLQEAEQAVQDEADYIGVGSIFATSTKNDAGAPVGTTLIEQISERWNIPQVGIGGITAHNASEVIQAGADGVAVVSAISRASNPQEAAQQLKNTIMELKNR